MNSHRTIAESYASRIWDDRDLTAIDELIDPSIVLHSLLGDYMGHNAMKRVMEEWLRGFPDLVVKNKSIICENDQVVMHWDATGTHQGEFKSRKASGKSVAYSGVSIYRFAHGKITEYWAYLDVHHLLNQID
jgi:steroid delta-isomerase-like uncharacterized protein